MKSNRRTITLWAACLLSHSVYATSGQPYIGASLAASFAGLGNANPQIDYFSGTWINDAYPLDQQHASAVVASINGGYTFSIRANTLDLAMGIGAYTTPGAYAFKGALIETASGDASSLLYRYNYQLRSSRLMAEIQLSCKTFERINPFLQAGIGSAWNSLHAYQETPVTANGFVALSPFQNQQKTNFSYQVGAGLSTGFHFAKGEGSLDRLSLGYRYVNSGDSSFATRGIAYPYALNAGTLSANEVYLAYTHLL